MTTKQASNSQVTFVTQKRFAVPFFPPSCWVNSLFFNITWGKSFKNRRDELLKGGLR